MKWILASIIAVFFLASCANFYEYKYVKNANRNKRSGAFKRDKEKCNVIAKKRAGTFNNLTYSGTTPGDKETRHYEKCMYRHGWRKK